MTIKRFEVVVVSDFVPPFGFRKVTVEAFNERHARNIVRRHHRPVVAISSVSAKQ